MALTEVFAQLLRQHRDAKQISQEELAEGAGLDRTYISQLERGLKSPTLNTVEQLATHLQISPAQLLEEIALKEELALNVAEHYIVRNQKQLTVRRGETTHKVPASQFVAAIDTAHELIEQIYAVELDIASMLGMRNLSAFIGELYASSVIKNSNDSLKANPHQDGYPDLLIMDAVGKKEWSRLVHLAGDKKPFSPFIAGGIEVKATCGSVPTPASCRKRKVARPQSGDSRIHCIASYDWKAHHRETNNLAAVLWDFIDRRPRIVAVFYSSDLTENDWGKIVQPRTGGGRTTSVSIMNATGIKKMYEGWLCVLAKPEYIDFINKKNKGSIIPRP